MKSPRNTVLIVDDNPEITKVLGMILTTLGYGVAMASNGQEALVVLKQLKSNLPCSIILDLMMPVMDGWEFIERLRSSEVAMAQIPVIISSAFQDSEIVARSNGCDFLLKPVALDSLRGAVEKHCSCAGDQA